MVNRSILKLSVRRRYLDTHNPLSRKARLKGVDEIRIFPVKVWNDEKNEKYILERIYLVMPDETINVYDLSNG